MTLKDDDQFDGEEAIEALTPTVEEGETPMQEDTDEVEQGEPSGEPAASRWQTWYRRLAPLLGYLPTGRYEEDTERDGLLSYSVEVHVFLFGWSIGATAATTGDMQLAMAFVTLALGIGRSQQSFSATVRKQVLEEPAYALGGAVIGWAAIHYDVLAMVTGVGG